MNGVYEFTEHQGYSYIYCDGSRFIYPVLGQALDLSYYIIKEESSLAISSEGDAMEFVYIRDLKSDGGTQGSHGC